MPFPVAARALAALTLAGSVSCASAPGARTGSGEGTGSAGSAPGPAPGVAAGRFVSGTFATEPGSRRYELWVPSGYDASRRHPLVVMLHGCTQDPQDLAKGTRVAAHADRAGALVLLPEQPDSANPRKCWNWFDPAHQLRDRGEPALLAGMAREIMREYAVDERRVYIAGVSAGAAMASLAAVAYPELFAAVGLHSGIPYRGAASAAEALGVMANGVADAERLAVLARGEMGERARPIPAILFQGGSDPIVKPVNARQSVEQWLGMNDLAARRKPAPGGKREVRRDEGSAGGYAYTRDCYPGFAGFPDAKGCMVESWTVTELGHAWSGGSREGTFTDDRGPDATAEMFRFFAEHRWAPVPDAPPGR